MQVNTGSIADHLFWRAESYADCSPGSVSTADGSALIRMGGTVVMCGIKAVSCRKRDPQMTTRSCHLIVVYQPCA